MIDRRSYQIATAFAAIAIGAAFSSPTGAGTLVQINTSLGAIKLKLNDEVTPATVTNFLNYVSDGDYTNTIVHRSVPGVVIQAGGFHITSQEIPADPPVVNEFNLPNAAGTIAMAKLPDEPNSARSQWFINVGDNQENLDNQNGGFTVFGHVIEGMNFVEEIADLPRFNFSVVNPDFGELPLRNYAEEDYNNQEPPMDHLVVITSTEMIGTWTPAWHNTSEPADATNDGNVFPQDLLV
jgi:peptidyl-prolyl cis-trans isomerase A (cyclophilin A)